MTIVRMAWITSSGTSRRESSTGLFGGNSNWRGPIWFPINFLLDRDAPEVPPLLWRRFLGGVSHGSGQKLTLWQIADQLSCRLTHIFLRGEDGRRPVFGTNETFQTNPHWRDYPSVLRVLPWRYRQRRRCQPSDRLDCVVAKLLEQTEGR